MKPGVPTSGSACTATLVGAPFLSRNWPDGSLDDAAGAGHGTTPVLGFRSRRPGAGLRARMVARGNGMGNERMEDATRHATRVWHRAVGSCRSLRRPRLIVMGRV